MPESILVVDDEREIADLVALYLQNEGYTVFHCATAAEALQLAASQPLDLAILDIMLPDESGLTLCRRLREAHRWPILMLSARGEEVDKITGLTLGADDYVTKPFLPLELVARVKAQLRRCKRYDAEGPDAPEPVAHAGLVMDTATHTCTLNEKPLSLTPTEFTILYTLCVNKGRVVSAEELFHAVWKDEYFSKSNNTITVHIRHLREKLGDTPDHPRYIRTVWGVGYRLET